MFKYGKKKPQGATRNSPKSNTPAPQAPSNSFLPSWLLVGFGLATGLFLAFVLYLWHPWRPVHKVEAPVATAPSDTPPKDTTDPRFDFYTLLPSQKVNTSTAEAPATTEVKTPAPAKIDSPSSDKSVKTATTNALKTEKAAVVKNQDPKGKTAKESHQEQIAKEKIKAKEAEAKKQKDLADKEKALAKAKALEKAKPATDANVHYTLQAGSFKSSAEADRRRANIVMSGLPVRVQKVTVKEGEVWYRVVVGPFAGKDKASQARQNLQSDGVDSMMVKQDKK